MRPGFAVDDGVALHFIGTQLHRAVSSRRSGGAYHVEAHAGGVHEAPLDVDYLGAPASTLQVVAA
jgi:dipeptidase E